jgi:hypothetical protein
MPDLRFLSSARRKASPTSWSRATRAGGHRLANIGGSCGPRLSLLAVKVRSASSFNGREPRASTEARDHG